MEIITDAKLTLNIVPIPRADIKVGEGGTHMEADKENKVIIISFRYFVISQTSHKEQVQQFTPKTWIHFHPLCPWML
jgi:hypothetical protein